MTRDVLDSTQASSQAPARAATRVPATQVFAGRRVTLYAPVRSAVLEVAPTVLRLVERVVGELEAILDLDRKHREPAVEVLLLEPGLDLAVPPVSGAAPIRLVYRPDVPTRSLVWYLVAALIGRWFGPRGASARLLVDGLAGLVAARLDEGVSVQQADAWVRGEVADGRPVSIFRPFDPTGSRAALSFVGYLLQTAGPEALRRLLAEYDPERRDEAVLAVYKRTLGALEEAWLAAVERGPSGRTALRSFLRHLGPLLRPYWLRQAEVLVYMLFELGYGLALPLGSMVVVDTIIPGGNVELLAAFVVGLLAVYGLDALVGMRRVYVNEWINERILTDLRARMFDHLQRLPHSYYAAAKVGDVMARLFGDLTIVGQALAQLAGVGIFLALRAVVTAIALLVLHPLLGSLVLIVVPLFVLAYLALERRLERTSYDLQNLSGEVEAAAQENLSAHGTIKAFGLERRESESFRARLLAQFRTSLRMSVLGAAFETSTGLAISLGELVVIGAGSYLVMRGELSVGTLLAFIGLLALLFQPIGMLSNVGQTVQKAAGALERVAELLDEPVAIADRPGAAPLCRHTGTIRFDHVTFGYRPDRPILRDLSLAVPAGRHVAIVGPSGAGKSTLVNLLLRFWDPDQGRILLDGQDARDVQLASLRGNIGVVFQDTFVFDSTLRENIAIGRAGASDAEIVAAAKAARLHEYIESLPAGYDTLAGERGVRMSGGQRQRLAIARALLRNPAILIMDEPTSALDARTERELLDTLRAAARDRTTITITHRLSLAAAADHVLVLSDGRLVEQGSHAELVRAGGLYRRLFEEQAGLQDAASVTTRNLKLVERSA